MFDPIARLKKRLAEGQILIGSGIYFTDPQASEALADSFDFLWYDMEHSGMSLEALRNHLMVARTKNKPTIVRVTASGPEAEKAMAAIEELVATRFGEEA